MKSKRKLTWVWISMAALFTIGVADMASRSWAAPKQPPPPPAAAKPEEKPSAAAPAKNGQAEVVVGAFVNQIHEFSLKDNSFTVDFYLWFRWKDPELKPYETWSLVDGRVEDKGEAVVKDLPDGSKHAYLRVVGKVTRFFDVTDYPLDNHALTIVIEEENEEIHRVKYVADTQNSSASATISLPGWQFARLSSVAESAAYTSNFGDVSVPTGNSTQYARLTTAVSFTRAGWTYFVKMFFALWTCVLVAMTAFFIKPTNTDPRFGLGVGALFGAIASQYTVAGALPETNVVTLADKLHLEAFLLIILSVMQSTWALALIEADKAEASHTLDVWSRRLIPLAFLIGVLFLVFTR
ncbi:MAG: hypothetical protein IT381_23805 [Deltaproteobacteria bacterium]|nr:hypothetical protein [Deltaproteobacteria bacterium]